jgi:hypothetical protein
MSAELRASSFCMNVQANLLESGTSEIIPFSETPEVGGAWAPPPPSFGISVNPIRTKGQIMPAMLLLAPPSFWIMRRL